jgi:N-sulfoglucosamine sulfohydrolase
VRTDSFLYILNKRPQFDNGGPIDANQSPSSKALKAAKKNGTLTPLQNDVFIKPRPVEEFFDVIHDTLQVKNLVGDKRYVKQMAQLKAVLQKWQDETADTAPAKLTPDWYDRETGQALPAKGTRGETPGASKKAETINAKGPF